MIYCHGQAAARRCAIKTLSTQHLASFLFASLIALCVTPGCQSQRNSSTSGTVATVRDYYRPAEDLGPLFHEVQTARIFPDGKTFVDMPAKISPESIASRYAQNKDTLNFDLKAFVEQNFLPPKSPPAIDIQKSPGDMFAHIEALWPKLIRPADTLSANHSTLIPLPHLYVVPGGRFREIYYWDSYFTMQGLVHGKQSKTARAMVENFAWLIDHAGHIPNGNRSYYLSRSQPPFFSSMVALLNQNNLAKPGEFLPQLEKEHRFWMAGADPLTNNGQALRAVKMANGDVLNRYYDALDTPRPESYREDIHTAELAREGDKKAVYRHLRAAAESGWDFSSRWLAPYGELPTIHTTDIVPVDLNSLLYHLEREIARQHQQLGNSARAQLFLTKAEKRKNAIRRWLWDERLGLYADYSLRTQQTTGIASLATVYPLYFSLATDAQAKRIAHVLQRDFLKDGGLVTSLQATGEQWDFPNGWAPLQWLAIIGLRQYDQQDLAATVAQRWLSLNRKVFTDTGRMMEKYNVVDITLPAGGGEYPTQDGFGWTNGVATALNRLYPQAVK
jgi:alpha,alpha-trehalase